VSIFKKLRTMMIGDTDPQPTANPTSLNSEQIAAAALMVEVATQDGEFSRVEREHIMSLLEQRLGLSPADATELFVEALASQNESNQILGFTRKIKDHFDEAGRENILELLWEVVFADGKEDAYESNLLRRVTGLLYISDKRNGAIRKRVKARLADK